MLGPAGIIAGGSGETEALALPPPRWQCLGAGSLVGLTFALGYGDYPPGAFLGIARALGPGASAPTELVDTDNVANYVLNGYDFGNDLFVYQASQYQWFVAYNVFSAPTLAGTVWVPFSFQDPGCFGGETPLDDPGGGDLL